MKVNNDHPHSKPQRVTSAPPGGEANVPQSLTSEPCITRGLHVGNAYHILFLSVVYGYKNMLNEIYVIFMRKGSLLSLMFG